MNFPRELIDASKQKFGEKPTAVALFTLSMGDPLGADEVVRQLENDGQLVAADAARFLLAQSERPARPATKASSAGPTEETEEDGIRAESIRRERVRRMMAKAVLPRGKG